MLSHVRSECSNQYLGVQMWGSLDGNTYNVSIGQPTPGTGDGVLEFLGAETLTSRASDSWSTTNNAGVTHYNAATGATFDVQLAPDSGTPSATGILYVTGTIAC